MYYQDGIGTNGVEVEWPKDYWTPSTEYFCKKRNKWKKKKQKVVKKGALAFSFPIFQIPGH